MLSRRIIRANVMDAIATEGYVESPTTDSNTIGIIANVIGGISFGIAEFIITQGNMVTVPQATNIDGHDRS